MTCYLWSLKTDVDVPPERSKQKNLEKQTNFLLASWKPMTKREGSGSGVWDPMPELTITSLYLKLDSESEVQLFHPTTTNVFPIINKYRKKRKSTRKGEGHCCQVAESSTKNPQSGPTGRKPIIWPGKGGAGGADLNVLEQTFYGAWATPGLRWL